MFRLDVKKNMARLDVQENMTSGSKNVYVVHFDFSAEWDNLVRVAVFKRGSKIINVLLDDTNECMIPWEILEEYGVPIDFGVFGTMNNEVVLPTIWVRTDIILEGVITGLDMQPPTPTLYEQILARLNKLEAGGKSAYEVAVDNGFEGTEEEWLETLGGKSAYDLAVEDGFTGTLREWFDSLRGSRGENGTDGHSAYGLAVLNGFKGTVLEWLLSLQGKDGTSSYDIALQNGFKGTEQDWVKTIIGASETNLNVYSYDELYVGTWIDGKPLYRKVFSGLATAAAGTIRVGRLPAMENLCRRDPVIKMVNGDLIGEPDGCKIITHKNGNVDIVTTTDVNYTVVLEYTKVNDIPGEPPQGGGDVEVFEIEFGHGLKVEDDVVMVDTYNEAAAVPDETLPIDAEGVTTIIDEALDTIEDILVNM